MIKTLPCLPLRNITLLPGTTMNIDVSREFSLNALANAKEESSDIFCIQQKDSRTDEPNFDDLYEWGTVAHVVSQTNLNGSIAKVIIAGVEKAKLIGLTLKDGVYVAVVDSEEVTPPGANDSKLDAIEMLYESELTEMFEMTDKYPKEIINGINDVVQDKIDRLNAYANMVLSVDNQEFLAEPTLVDKYTYFIAKIRDEKKIIEVQNTIESSINDKMMNLNREHILREQKRVIEEELGEEDDDDDLSSLSKAIGELKVSDEVRSKLKREFTRMKRLNPSSPDYAILRNYLEYVVELPWGKLSVDNDDLKKVKTILDEDHYGLDKVKDRILEYLAVRILTQGKGKGTILCLVGPPGVGKTSIAKSIARALDKEYVQMSLGGIHDEAEIRGHRKTYVGAMPGRIISSLHKAKYNNPLFLMDELDKVGNDLHKGDPSSALLEVLDPEQNTAFRDNYLEIPYDLSKVMFIMTANTLDTIQQPLLDRMEIIEMSSYTEQEKLAIATNYLVQKQKKESGVENITFSEGALLEIIRSYTREAGVRNLERKIGNICRKVARDIVENEKKDKEYKISKQNVASYLGKPMYFDEEITNGVGVCTGLAWTTVGGDTLSVEVSAVDGKGDILLTGNLGDVMQESAKTALTVVKARAKDYGVDPVFFEKHNIHVHVPEGAVPKDGPSAGITMATAIMSAVSGKSISKGLAMTGEITLRGRVLPIGGLKEKSIAAYRLGVKKILIPEENVKDLDDVPDVVKKNVEFLPVHTIDQVFGYSYGG